MLTIPGALATEKADRESVVFLLQAGLCRKVAQRKVFVYLKNTFWTKRQTNRKQFRTGGKSPVRDCFFFFYHHIGTQKSSKLVVIGIWIVIYRGFPRHSSDD